jgi:hypothetical protein
MCASLLWTEQGQAGHLSTFLTREFDQISKALAGAQHVTSSTFALICKPLAQMLACGVTSEIVL